MFTNFDQDQSFVEPLNHHYSQKQQATSYGTNVARSMTLDEMRQLHRGVLSEAEAKKKELHLVLESRYQDLVFCSDEVINMHKKAEELDSHIRSLPYLLESLILCGEKGFLQCERKVKSKGPYLKKSVKRDEDLVGDKIRTKLFLLPRIIYINIESLDVYEAAISLVELFTLISSYTALFPLANALGDANSDCKSSFFFDKLLADNIKFVYLQVETLPAKIFMISNHVLLLQSSCCSPNGAIISARAIAALNLLNVSKHTIPREGEEKIAAKLLDTYFEAKATLIHNLLVELNSPNFNFIKENNESRSPDVYNPEVSDAVEKTLLKIVLMIQYDIILDPYQIFCLRHFSSEHLSEYNCVFSNLPRFEINLVKNKVSNFLALHLPLVKTKVKRVLMTISGRTASYLGRIRQSLYEKTDGRHFKKHENNLLCTWESAVNTIIDLRITMCGLDGLSVLPSASKMGSEFISSRTLASSTSPSLILISGTFTNKFSLWNTLFSNSFSSLANSLLRVSFHSLHTRAVTSICKFLTNAPSLDSLLPQEAHQNTLILVTDLDEALNKVSDDANNLLVHKEEREASYKNIRQSLYVQTSEIMGLLLNQLRRMLLKDTVGIAKNGFVDDIVEENNSSIIENGVDMNLLKYEGTRKLMIGRLCQVLKFRLSSLPNLLNSDFSPVVMVGEKKNMINLSELCSSFEIADDDGDGIISFEEAIDVANGAFSGTHFHGADLLQESMLLSQSFSPNSEFTNDPSEAVLSSPYNITLSELALICARGLMHDATGPLSALGTIQRSLDSIVRKCFSKWACVALASSGKILSDNMKAFIDTATTLVDIEWKHLHYLVYNGSKKPVLEEEIRNDGAVVVEESQSSISSTSSSIPIGSVSSHILSYLLSVASVLNRSICPSDSLFYLPSLEYAEAMNIEVGYASTTVGGSFTMLYNLRAYLLQESLKTATNILGMNIVLAFPNGGNDNLHEKVLRSSTTSLVQLKNDVDFIYYCFFLRNNLYSPILITEYTPDYKEKRNEGVNQSIINNMEKFRSLLYSISQLLHFEMKKRDVPELDIIAKNITEKHRKVVNSCDLFISSLFGPDTSYTNPTLFPKSYDSNISELNAKSSESPAAIMLNPINSSRRFVLLPTQIERASIQLKFSDEMDNDGMNNVETGLTDHSSVAANAVSSGFDFISSMLGKK